MISKYNVEYKNGLFLDLHLPEAEEFDLFVYFHGGGLCAGQRGGVEVFAKTLAEKKIATATVDYRMYPRAKFPEFIEDAADSVAWLKEHIGTYGICKRIFVGGSSAGGYLSMMLCFDGRYLARVGLVPTDIDAYIHNAGQPTAHFNVLKEFGVDSKRVIVDERAPLYFVGTAETYSPMLFLVSDHDMACRYEQTMLMVKTLQHFGHGDRVSLRVMEGKHCSYDRKEDSDGNGIFGTAIFSFLDEMGFFSH